MFNEHTKNVTFAFQGAVVLKHKTKNQEGTCGSENKKTKVPRPDDNFPVQLASAFNMMLCFENPFI